MTIKDLEDKVTLVALLTKNGKTPEKNHLNAVMTLVV